MVPLVPGVPVVRRVPVVPLVPVVTHLSISSPLQPNVTLSGKINHLVLFMKSEIITPPESPSIADHSGTLTFLIGLTILELWAFNPLTTEFFPPRQHIFMHPAHTTFVGTSLPQHSLLSGQTWWGPHAWRDPSGNTVNDIHDPPQGQQSEVKGGCQPDFRPAFP